MASNDSAGELVRCRLESRDLSLHSMKHVLPFCSAVAGGAIALAVAVVVVVLLLVSLFLFGLMFLQAVGLAPRVPLGYSFRNLSRPLANHAADHAGFHARRRR